MQVCFSFSHNTPQMVHSTNLRPRPVSVLLNFFVLHYKVAINDYIEHHEFYHIFLIFLGNQNPVMFYLYLAFRIFYLKITLLFISILEKTNVH